MIPFIDLKKQYRRIESQVDKAIKNVLEHGQYILGPEVAELEKQLAELAGTKYCLACSSGTDALLMGKLAILKCVFIKIMDSLRLDIIFPLLFPQSTYRGPYTY